MTRLSSDALTGLDPRVTVPDYDRSAITPGIAHIGVGGFHRAHQACYLDSLLQQGLAQDWGLIGIGLLPHDQGMRDALAGQDHVAAVEPAEKTGIVLPQQD
ncbi:hypothetical protein KNN17_21580 [Arthrobacter bambusae]|nr:hypothetical protein [Arthrobacter bambusae]MCI0144143.1 hypothetical protein [Arthrobacter bambusae]